jgi:hypothetical protein
MRNIFLLIFLLLLPNSVSAQDLLKTKRGPLVGDTILSSDGPFLGVGPLLGASPLMGNEPLIGVLPVISNSGVAYMPTYMPLIMPSIAIDDNKIEVVQFVEQYFYPEPVPQPKEIPPLYDPPTIGDPIPHPPPSFPTTYIVYNVSPN